MIKATTHKLEVARKKRYKREEIIERWKTEAMTVKHWRAKRGISSSIEEKEDYKSNTGDEMDPD